MEKKDFNACVKDAYETGYKKGRSDALIATADSLLEAAVEIWKRSDPLAANEDESADATAIALRSFSQIVRRDALNVKIKIPEAK